MEPSKKKLLVIEDEQPAIQAYREKFRKEYNFCTATEGPEGIRKAKKIKPDIIILDILFPGEVNGIDVLRELKDDPETREIPIIVLTNLETTREDCMNLGASECLIKAHTSLKEVAALMKGYLS